LKDAGVDGRIKFKLNLEEKGWESLDWFGLAQNGEKWWAVLNSVKNLRVLAAKCGESCDWMRNHLRLKKDSAT